MIFKTKLSKLQPAAQVLLQRTPFFAFAFFASFWLPYFQMTTNLSK
jgi:hypothetical protein